MWNQTINIQHGNEIEMKTNENKTKWKLNYIKLSEILLKLIEGIFSV